jgi:hypothetical protein
MKYFKTEGRRRMLLIQTESSTQSRLEPMAISLKKFGVPTCPLKSYLYSY